MAQATVLMMSQDERNSSTPEQSYDTSMKGGQEAKVNSEWIVQLSDTQLEVIFMQVA